MASNVPCDSPSVCLPLPSVCLPWLWVAIALTTAWHPFTFSGGAAAGQKYLCAFRFLGEAVLWPA